MGGHRKSSDHLPISLSSEVTNWGPKPFRVFDDWVKKEEVMELIKKVINDHNDNNWYGLMRKIKFSLKHWSIEQGRQHAVSTLSLDDEIQR